KRVSSLNSAIEVSVPKARLATVEHSPFCCRFRRSQSGLKLPLRGSPAGNVKSFQVLVVVVLTPAGLPIVETPSTYFPRLAFNAVFPVPKRSYATPRRGVTSCRLMLVTAGNVKLRVG